MSSSILNTISGKRRHVITDFLSKWATKKLRRNKSAIGHNDHLKRPLHFHKCLADRRHSGVLSLDNPHPLFLTEADLAPADILFCPNDETDLIRAAISYGSAGDYVHTAIYIGKGYAIEAANGGVVKVKLDDVIKRYPYVAVARCFGANPEGVLELSKKVVDFCLLHAQAKTPYNLKGALMAPLLELQELELQNRTKRWSVPNHTGSPIESLFCSQLVVEAFINGGYIPEGTVNSASYSPTKLAEDRMFGLIGYFGDQALRNHIRDNDYFLTGGIPRACPV
ncbi:Orthopoxvirus protein of uncharacterised function (DUF830) [Pseudomonas luteola]|uniref:Orthopoxvirus protein of uncharacterized function (DUF830) n=1 Tax=Pseudomonas luteola TaxID=47886 RepID=A0A2X2CBT4_PSELU|nr:hypothetical protein [Pseudomonas luteola]SPZ04948.1 Orthopoxvirus protein of uncharacterised function (DUF830) [Pseudomonas luteola]